MVRIGRLDKPIQVVRPDGQPTGPEPTRFWGQWSIGLGVLTFTSGLFLLLMFISLALGGRADPWGPINDLLSGIANLLLAALIPVISRRAAGGRWERVGMWLTAGASVVGSAASFLLVAGVMPFEQSTAVSIAVILLQVLWMLWLNLRFRTDPGVPRPVSTFGLAFAGSMLTGLVAFSLSFLTAADNWLHTALQGLGGAVAGVAWLSWPLWFILLGRHLAAGGSARGNAVR